MRATRELELAASDQRWMRLVDGRLFTGKEVATAFGFAYGDFANTRCGDVIQILFNFFVRTR